MRIVVRDAEWLVKHVGAVHHEGGRIFTVLTCVGVSNLVSGRTSKFIVEYEERPELKQKIQILDPKETRLVQDDSVNYVRTRLFIDALLRRTPATDAKIHIAQDAAMDVLAYQLEPAVWALESTRPRILIADAVGIGKTLEAGVLVSELIERQRGKRILVLAVKAMLEQFQQEFWNRFSIPLTRLDSDGIARLQQRIPASHNPFLYVDKAIISIDTLKQSALYRTYLEQAYWDIILIDEAHNVAERSSGSQRAALARLLSRRSDALIMLSATPHDGRPQSFASLIDMLDPTVIANPNDYTFDDFKDSKLVIRRFKNDIRDQAQGAFPERDIKTIKVNASLAEQAVYQNLENIEFKHIDANRKIGSVLFQTTLEKALFSSPAACISTCDNRIGKLRAAKTRVTEAGEDINTLTNQQFVHMMEVAGDGPVSAVGRRSHLKEPQHQLASGLSVDARRDRERLRGIELRGHPAGNARLPSLADDPQAVDQRRISLGHRLVGAQTQDAGDGPARTDVLSDLRHACRTSDKHLFAEKSVRIMPCGGHFSKRNLPSRKAPGQVGAHRRALQIVERPN